ncbi:hypothetical protein BDV10DRAFT_192695 [Aspergillus recurvatus]
MNSRTADRAKNYKITQDLGNFKEAESIRVPFKHSDAPIEATESPYPDWEYGQGVPEGVSKPNILHEIDAIAPRPIVFVASAGKGRKMVENLAPFSYFQLIDHDPPMFILRLSGRPGRVKDTSRSPKETGECVINTVSENTIEAVNATSLDAPYAILEWEISGLAKAPRSTVRPARVKFAPHQEGMSGSGVVLIKATRFWVKEGVVDEDFSHIALEKLRPVARLGGISYGRIMSTFERLRTRWAEEVEKSPVLKELEGRYQDGDSK